MSKLSDTNPRYLLEQQYKSDKGLSSRLKLHERFSTNRTSWHTWVFDQLQTPDRALVLELGCGNGALWSENQHRVPDRWQIILTDFSDGMLSSARVRVRDHRFSFQIVDAQRTLPFESDSVDLVMANHVLYHVPDRNRALSEIRRVLSAGGAFYASTNGRDHMSELDDLIQRFVPEVPRDDTAAKFGLETGLEQLANYFAEIDLRSYQDHLEVTDTEALMDYVTSTPAGELLTEERSQAIREHVEAEIQQKGMFFITKSAGLFICSDPKD
jgi:ubiquinone/menaquinone biosynthesis C-methylase UbiE